MLCQHAHGPPDAPPRWLGDRPNTRLSSAGYVAPGRVTSSPCTSFSAHINDGSDSPQVIFIKDRTDLGGVCTGTRTPPDMWPPATAWVGTVMRATPTPSNPSPGKMRVYPVPEPARRVSWTRFPEALGGIYHAKPNAFHGGFIYFFFKQHKLTLANFRFLCFCLFVCYKKFTGRRYNDSHN